MELDKELVSDLEVLREGDALTLIFKSETPNIVLRAILVILIALSSLFALAIVLNAIISGSFKIFHLLIPAVLFGCAYFLRRLYLWNTHGKEIITLSEDLVTYIADYGRFQDNLKEFNRSSIKVEIIEFNLRKPENRKLRIVENQKSITLATEKPAEVMTRVKLLIQRDKLPML